MQLAATISKQEKAGNLRADTGCRQRIERISAAPEVLTNRPDPDTLRYTPVVGALWENLCVSDNGDAEDPPDEYVAEVVGNGP